MKLYHYALIALAAGSLSLAACTPPSMGILYALEKEKKVDAKEKGLSKEATIKTILKFDGHWLVAGSTLAKTPVAATAGKTALVDYEYIPLPEGYTRYLSVAAGSDGWLYATVRNSANPAKYGVFARNSLAAGSIWGTALLESTETLRPWDLITTQPDTAGAAQDSTVLLLLATLDSENKYSKGELRLLTGGTDSDVSAGALAGELPSTLQPRFVVNDGGVFHLFASNGVHYTGTLNDGNFTAAASSPTARVYNRARVLDNGDIVLLSNDGYIAASGDGTSWTDSAQMTAGTGSNAKAITFTDARSVDLDDGANPNFIANLATSDNYGLLILSENPLVNNEYSAVPLSATNGNYHSTKIYQKSMYTLSSDADHLFVGTENLGFWSALHYAIPGALASFPGLVWINE